MPARITLTNDRYVVFPHNASAEISVHRSGGGEGDVDFVWWAEESGATAGKDFIARAPRRAHLPGGVDSVQLIVPILANPSRRHTEMFYVAIAATGGGATLGAIHRAAVFIMRPD